MTLTRVVPVSGGKNARLERVQGKHRSRSGESLNTLKDFATKENREMGRQLGMDLGSGEEFL